MCVQPNVSKSQNLEAKRGTKFDFIAEPLVPCPPKLSSVQNASSRKTKIGEKERTEAARDGTEASKIEQLRFFVQCNDSVQLRFHFQQENHSISL